MKDIRLVIRLPLCSSGRSKVPAPGDLLTEIRSPSEGGTWSNSGRRSTLAYSLLKVYALQVQAAALQTLTDNSTEALYGENDSLFKVLLPLAYAAR
jgi:hypothetical protein